MSIHELQEIREGLCAKVERLIRPGGPLDPETIAQNGQGYACGMWCGAHLHYTPLVLKFWMYQDANLALWELQKELRARELQLAVAMALMGSEAGFAEAALPSSSDRSTAVLA